MDLARRLFKGDRVIWIIFAILCAYSLVFVFSATSTIAYKNDDYLGPILEHARNLLIGFAAILLLHNCPLGMYRKLSIFGLILSVALLVITLFWGVEINGAKRWLDIGFRFQTSEIAKIGLINYIAYILSRRKTLTDKQIFLRVLGSSVAICGTIFPENGSTALLLFAFSILMMIIGQISIRYWGKLCAYLLLSGAFCAAILHFTPEGVIKEMPDRVERRVMTWKGRVEDFFKPEPEVIDQRGQIKDDYRQVVNAKIAIAHSNVIGSGPGWGKQRDFLSQAYSDFIYAIILEEGGLIVGVFLLLIYVVLMIRGGMIAKKCPGLYAKYLIVGCVLLIGLQALTNMAVAVGLIPVTGQPLPLISRGGTSTVLSCVYIGLILAVSRFGANIGNEKDELPAEPKEPKALPAISDEDIANWVQEIPEGGVPQTGDGSKPA